MDTLIKIALCTLLVASRLREIGTKRARARAKPVLVDVNEKGHVIKNLGPSRLRLSPDKSKKDIDQPSDLTVATYNLWNVMFHWEVRKLHIADMIDTHDIDVIGFQEVRGHADNHHNQLLDLQELLPKHKWTIYHQTRIIKKGAMANPPGWELEGIGILSKHRILSYHIVNLTKTNGEDNTPRAILSAQISIDGEELSVAVTHFSYDQNDQCHNAWDVLKYLHSARSEKTILLGDFNTYNDYSWPIELLKTGNMKKEVPSVCKRKRKPWFHGHKDFEFVDVWAELHPRKKGFTFSNMPEPGLQSRPDRILISKPGFKIDSIFLLGQGDEYKKDYRHKLYVARLKSIHNAAYQQANGEFYDSSCYWDCGPHGVCRCGICVKKRDDNCDETYCPSCGPASLRYYQFLQAILVALMSLFAFSLLVLISRLLLIDARPRLCTKLYRTIVVNKYFIIMLLFGMAAVYSFLKWNYSDVLELVDSQIPEELFPSDHLMVVARITID